MDNKEKIVFMGTPKFASKILEGLFNAGFNIVAVVCQPDKPVGRKKILTACDVKQKAIELKIPVYTPNRIKKEFEDIVALKPNLIVTSAYGQIIPKQILDCPKYGCINTHGSLLPKYRGASPIQSAIMNGETSTGMSIMFMNEKMDEGDILYQRQIDIDIHDTSTTLFEKMSELALEMLIEFIPKIFKNDIYPIKQDDALATYAPMLNKDDEQIHFNDDALKVYNHIRGLLDNPGCYFIVDNKRYRIEKAFFEYDDNTNSNTFIGVQDDYLRIDCVNGYIKIYDIKPEGKNVMNAKSFYNGVGRNLVGKKIG